MSDGHADLVMGMLRALPTQSVKVAGSSNSTRPLAALNVDAEHDFAVAIVHAWAAVCENLDFYTGFLGDESALDKAKEFRSVRELVRLLGYEPQPAVAASTVVAFTVRELDSGPDEVAIPRGVPIQSIPRPGELENETGPPVASAPQVFETSDDLAARAAWNSLRLPAPPLEPPFVASQLTRWFTVETPGVTPRAGHGVLFRSRPGDDGKRPSDYLFRIVRSVEQLNRVGSFRLHLEPEPLHPTDVTIIDPEVHLLTLKTAPFGADAALWPRAPDEAREPVGTHEGWLMRRPFRCGWKRPTQGLPPVGGIVPQFAGLPGARRPTLDVQCVEYAEDEVLYAGTDGAGVFRIGRPVVPDTDHTTAIRVEPTDVVWQPVGTGLEDASVTALTIGPSGRVYAGTRDEGVFVWTRETDRWEPLGERVQKSRHSRRWGPNREVWPKSPVRSLLAMDAFGRERLFAGTDRGVFRWANEDKGWVGVGSGLPDWDLDTARSSVVALGVDETRLDVFAATGRGVYRSRWLGYNWHPRSKGMAGRGEQPPGINDLLATRWGAKSRPVLFAATADGVFRSDDSGGRWEQVGDAPAECRPVRSLAVGGFEELFAGTSRGVLCWTETTREWRPVPPPIACDPRGRLDHDPNLRYDHMLDVRAIAGHRRRGQIVAAMPRGDFLELDWPGFWIDFPVLDVPKPNQTPSVASPIVLRHRTTHDVLAATIVESAEMTRAGFGLDEPITRFRLDLDPPLTNRLDEQFPIRTTDVYADSTLISVVTALTDRIRPVRGLKIRLDADVEVPPVGRLIAVTGRPARVRLDQAGGVFEVRGRDHAAAEGIGAGARADGLAWCDVVGVAESSHGIQYAVLAGGSVWAREPCGRDWVPAAAEFPSGMTALTTASNGGLYAVVGSGGVRSRAGAGLWDRLASQPPGTIEAVAAGPDGRLLALADSDSEPLWELSTSGTAWKPSSLGLPRERLTAIAFGSDGALVAATAAGSILEHQGGSWHRCADLAFTDIRSICRLRDGRILVGTRPVLHLSSDRGERVASIEPTRLFDCSLTSTDDLSDGSISKELADTFAKHVPELGDLTVMGASGDATLLTDVESHARYAVRRGLRRAVVVELPVPFRIDRDRVRRIDGATEWYLRTRSGDAGHAAIPPRLLSFVHADEADPEYTEVAVVAGVVGPDARHRSTLRLKKPLRQAYDSSTVTLNANAVNATAGARSKHEIIGSGDAGRAHQEFGLSHVALTYTGNGIEGSTLVVEVSELVERTVHLPGAPDANEADMLVQWKEVDALVNAGPDDRVYEVRHDDEQRTTVRLGDGTHGARLPSGHGNVVATYRHAPPGAPELEAGQLTLLLARPRGVTAVTNPIPSSGGKRAEDIHEARVAAPRWTRSNGRVVSLRDVEWFSEAFDGIEHASAVRLRSGSDEVIHVSVATGDGSEIDLDSPVLKNLAVALTQNRAVLLPDHVVQEARWTWLTIEAQLVIDPNHDSDEVVGEALDAVMKRYGIQRAEFGVDVAAADLIGLLQSQIGVIGVDLTTFSSKGDVGEVEAIVPAPLARTKPDANTQEPAVLIAVRRDRDVTIRAAEVVDDE